MAHDPSSILKPRPTTILHVDDNEANRYAVSRMLKRAGFTVVEAATGEEAMRHVANGPDLVVLDINLPDIDGFEVCRRIKADAATSSIPVLHMSASYILSEDKTRGLDEGADGYLIRPVQPPELIATVRALLRVRSAENEARRAALRWRATFDAIGDGVFLLDRDGLIKTCNRSAGLILGLDPIKAVGKPLGSMIAMPGPGEDLALGERWYRIGSDPVPDDEAREVGSVLTLTDVTDRHRLEDELRSNAQALVEDDRRKDEFLAMLAHELHNPLAPIRDAFEVMRGAEGSTVAELATIRQVAERQVRHLTRLVDDLLDVSRISGGKIQIRREVVDLAEVLARVVASARSTVEGTGQSLLVEIPAVPLLVLGDPIRLEQILANLLNNAAKYTEPGGRITLKLARVGGHVEVRVIDTGLGIPPEILPRVFDLFTQADRSLDRSQGGLGIGLTLVRRLVMLHGGTVSAFSEGAGRGSEFLVRLPIKPEAGDASIVGEASPAGPPPPIARRVLVVDDQADAATMLARLLRDQGHDVEVAADGFAAIEMALKHRPEVILLDIGLPGIDGYEVARRLRATPELQPILLIALTGYGQDEDIRLAHQAGFDHHLIKPTDLPAIEALLARGQG